MVEKSGRVGSGQSDKKDPRVGQDDEEAEMLQSTSRGRDAAEHV
jgi:hypothetical protein